MMGCGHVAFSKTANSHLIYGSTDEGEVYTLDWSVKTADEGGKPNILTSFKTSEKNGRPTVAVDTSPFYDDLLLTIHDSHFCIWKTECQEPVFVSPFISPKSEKTFITCGFFSPSRQGVVYIGRADGTIDIWDFMDQSNSPTQEHFVVAIGISSMEINTNEKENDSLAVGDMDGCLHLLKLPINLRKKIPGEQEAIQNFFNKEMQRVIYFKDRFKEREDIRAREEALIQRKREEEEFKTVRRDDVDSVYYSPMEIKLRSS